MHAADGNGEIVLISTRSRPRGGAQQAAFAIDNLLDLRRVGEHRNDNVRVLRESPDFGRR